MQRSPDGKSLSPKLYVADEANFSAEEKDNLQALQLTDIGFAEIFFGSYPIIVEGDTEHAEFISAIVKTQHEMAGKISIIRARGKAVLVPLIKCYAISKATLGSCMILIGHIARMVPEMECGLSMRQFATK
ncbi:hypothetical protein LN650_11240 [Klebsiella pneumoniae subsp. pneumoniae]|nr:hypothetical protein [Klebsiella pneumoniae subsp. pneumoniae]